jgi:hypothetical protein
VVRLNPAEQTVDQTIGWGTDQLGEAGLKLSLCDAPTFKVKKEFLSSWVLTERLADCLRVNPMLGTESTE